jgi:hypothetical protein
MVAIYSNLLCSLLLCGFKICWWDSSTRLFELCRVFEEIIRNLISSNSVSNYKHINAVSSAELAAICVFLKNVYLSVDTWLVLALSSKRPPFNRFWHQNSVLFVAYLTKWRQRNQQNRQILFKIRKNIIPSGIWVVILISLSRATLRGIILTPVSVSDKWCDLIKEIEK